MTWTELDPAQIEALSDDELRTGLASVADEDDWNRRAAVGLVLGLGGWVSRWEFRQAVRGRHGP